MSWFCGRNVPEIDPIDIADLKVGQMAGLNGRKLFMFKAPLPFAWFKKTLSSKKLTWQISGWGSSPVFCYITVASRAIPPSVIVFGFCGKSRFLCRSYGTWHIYKRFMNQKV